MEFDTSTKQMLEVWRKKGKLSLIIARVNIKRGISGCDIHEYYLLNGRNEFS